MGGAIALRAHPLHGAEPERGALANAVAMRPWGAALVAPWLTEAGRGSF